MAESSPGRERLRLAVAGIATIVVLAVVNLQIVGKERLVADGRTVLLELAPLDPRSLLQGDYMLLRYALADDVAGAAQDAGTSDGTAVVALAADGVASFARIDDGSPLAADEQRLRFRKRGEAVRLASDAYFFEEGSGDAFSRARYGELRVAADGSAVLVGLRNADRQPIPPP